MKDPTPWRGALEQRVPGGEPLLALLGGEFSDRPKSMRTGLLAVTPNRLAFYRRKAFGEEYLEWPLDEISAVEVGFFGGLASILGGDVSGVEELQVTMKAGQALRMAFIQSGDPRVFAGVVQGGASAT